MENNIDRTWILNRFIKSRGYKKYLEIGVGAGENIDRIQCDYIVGVDPNNRHNTDARSSNEFFANCNEMFDIIFVDGCHFWKQTECDILNSLQHINVGGVIVVHDCNPEQEYLQIVPRFTRFWTGNVWKAFAKFREEWDYRSFVIDADYGCGVIEYDRNRDPIRTSDTNYNWDYLETNRQEILNLISVDRWLEDFRLQSESHRRS